ncbi:MULTISPECIES: guanylate kinase [Butyricimonas]|uniref:Guanylate kinase n=1 Tax=Butyricimonas hominis TaxID=2763032 RepID=A0ABR7CWP5_9BACT|nr:MULTISPECIES: guanylate kinase [Butyricimonas]MBC5619947.1 guanylate kinase [Butyricimonas hominis]MCB6973830.1 guanylate kinase [Butyricimonas synergistica]MCG4520641.1 guanylate kinase [Butyricimonas sp. DFI.6.44]
MKKVIIFSAPSGSGKSTIVNYLLSRGLGLEFSISATCRSPRGEERHGKEYYFFSTDEFRQKIDKDDFLEWEQVYPGCYYGTLKSELERIWAKGHTVVFDVDVVGGVNIKKIFGERALSIFVQAPSVEVLRQRLESRGTDSAEKIEERVAKAEYEMTFADKFDIVVVNDKLESALEQAEKAVRDFLK